MYLSVFSENTADLYLHASENSLMDKVSNPLFDSWKLLRVSITKPWLIVAHLACVVSREPCNIFRICTTAPNSIFSCSAVFMPVCQTDCMCDMCECGGHLQFYAMPSDQSVGLALAGHRTGCVCVQQRSGVMCETSSMAVIRASLGCALAEWWSHTGALKPVSQKRGGIWTACLTRAVFSDSRVMPDDLSLQMEHIYLHRYALLIVV